MRCFHLKKEPWDGKIASAYGKPLTIWVQKCKTCPKIWTLTDAEYREMMKK